VCAPYILILTIAELA